MYSGGPSFVTGLQTAGDELLECMGRETDDLRTYCTFVAGLRTKHGVCGRALLFPALFTP